MLVKLSRALEAGEFAKARDLLMREVKKPRPDQARHQHDLGLVFEQLSCPKLSDDGHRPIDQDVLFSWWGGRNSPKNRPAIGPPKKTTPA
jgi:hypothetical protein